MTIPVNTNKPELPNHQRITYDAAKTLADLTHHLRNDWHQPGILEAIRPLAAHHPPQDIIHALTAATRPGTGVKTPAGIHYPGPWWPNHTTTAEHPTNHRPDPCPIPDHARAGRYANNCPECRKLLDFPPQIDYEIYERLDPQVRRNIDRAPGTVVLT